MLNVPHLFHQHITIFFFNLIPKHIDAFVPFGKTKIVSDGAFALINIHKHHFHYYGFSNLESVALKA